MKLYEIRFKATQTCNNGNEKTVTKKIYMKPFRTLENRIVYNGTEHQIRTGTALLKENHFYNIEYIDTKVIDRFIIE